MYYWYIAIFKKKCSRLLMVFFFKIIFLKEYIRNTCTIRERFKQFEYKSKLFVKAEAGKYLTLNAPIATKVVCFSRLLKCLRSLWGNCVDPEQTAPIGAVCSGSTLFVSILNLSVMLGNYLQQTTSADDIFRCIFFLAL